MFGRTETVRKINELKGRIQEIKFPFSHSEAENNEGKEAPHTLLKPSGKLKFKSAQRFFRMEMVPILKKIEPTLDSQGRQEVIRDLWTRLKDQHKLAYVLMSRADREKVMYLARLNQIREELRRAYPEEALLKQIAELREGKKHPKDLADSLNGNIHGLNALAKIEESMTEERQDEVNDDEEVEADVEFDVTCSSGFDASSMPQPGQLNLSAEKR